MRQEGIEGQWLGCEATPEADLGITNEGFAISKQLLAAAHASRQQAAAHRTAAEAARTEEFSVVVQAWQALEQTRLSRHVPDVPAFADQDA